jgi:hypothetical protein
MSAQATIARFQALQRSLQAAQDAEHPTMTSLTGEHSARYDGHVRGMRAGLQVAIDAITSELAIIAAGQRAAAAHAQPE